MLLNGHKTKHLLYREYILLLRHALEFWLKFLRTCSFSNIDFSERLISNFERAYKFLFVEISIVINRLSVGI